MITESPLQIHGDGEQTRDFIHVSDVADAIISLLTLEQRYAEQAVNICSGTQTSLLDLVAIINQELVRQRQLSDPPRPIFSEPLAGDIRHSLGSPILLQKLIHWRPKFALQMGIQNIIGCLSEESR